MTMFRRFVACTAFFSLIPAAALAQKCTEQAIRDAAPPTSTQAKASDVYFFSPMADKPIVGLEEWRKLTENGKKTSPNANMKGACKADRVVVAPSGEMAYAYGTCDMNFDDADGKHQKLTTAFLDVWRVVDDSCKLAARQVQPIKGER